MTDSRPLTGGGAVVAALRANGVDMVFGLPGLQLDHLFNAFHDAGPALRVINARHEQGVAYMALGAAQATGRPGVCAVVPGPGLLNASAALATAWATHAPMLALVGQIPVSAIGAGRGELHELADQSAIVASLTRFSGLARAPEQVPGLMADAFAALEAGVAPAAVELPADVLAAAAVMARPVATRPRPVLAPDPDAIAAAARLLAGARAPLIVVGGGALHAAAELDVVSARLGAPVVSHLQGRGLIPDADPRAIGRLAAFALWPETDVILAVGTRFNAPRAAWGLRPGQRVIRIDRDPAQFARGEPPDIAVEADARAALAALADALDRMGPRPPDRAGAIAASKARAAAAFAAGLAPQMAYVRALRAALPERSAVVADYTQVGYVATAAFPVQAPRRILTPGHMGTLGFAWATALGAKAALGDTPVVALCGDGGFLFTATELATATQHGLGAIAVVFADGAYGNVRRMQQTLHGGRVIGSELRNPDFVRLAESFGVPAERAEGPQAFEAALRRAVVAGGPALIEVPVGPMPDPWGLLEPA